MNRYVLAVVLAGVESEVDAHMLLLWAIGLALFFIAWATINSSLDRIEKRLERAGIGKEESK